MGAWVWMTGGCEATPESFAIGGYRGRLVTFMADVDDGDDRRVLLR